MMQLTLLGTQGCHLCHEAEAILLTFIETSTESYQLQLVDIAYNHQLMDSFATKIPVLLADHIDHHLAWPFNLEAINCFVINA